MATVRPWHHDDRLVQPKERFQGFFSTRRSTAPKFPQAARFGYEPMHLSDDARHQQSRGMSRSPPRTTTPGPGAYFKSGPARSSLSHRGAVFPKASRDAGGHLDQFYSGEAMAHHHRQHQHHHNHNGSSGRRALDDSAAAPGPGAYKLNLSTINRTHGAVFGTSPRAGTSSGPVATTRDRAHTARGERSGALTPGPGGYNAQKAFNRSSAAHKQPTATIGRASRFSDNSVFGRRLEPTPGAGAYAPKDPAKITANHRGGGGKGGVIGRASRSAGTLSNSRASAAPGPGSYTPLWGLVK